jgi:hypothetical protein
MTRTALTPLSRPPRSGRALAPTRLRVGQAPGSTQARPVAPHGLEPWGTGGSDNTTTLGDPHPKGNCGRAGPSTQQVQARSWASGLEGAYFAYG